MSRNYFDGLCPKCRTEPKPPGRAYCGPCNNAKRLGYDKQPEYVTPAAEWMEWLHATAQEREAVEHAARQMLLYSKPATASGPVPYDILREACSDEKRNVMLTQAAMALANELRGCKPGVVRNAEYRRSAA